MRKLFKFLAPITIIPMAVAPMATLSSCSKMYHDVKDLAPYLHEITYDDYRYDENWETTKGSGDGAFGCSSVRKGNLYGRNFDFVFNNTPEFVVHVKAKSSRHESIGVATHFGLREPKLIAGQYDKELELIPNLTLDGINDAGVICSHNVVSMEVNKEGNDFKPETHPGAAKTLHQLFVPRYVLDNASSVDEAVSLLRNPNLNIVGNLNNKHYLHIMISDSEKTVVVEFFPKKSTDHFDIVVDEKKIDDINTKCKEPIMTNYYVNNYNNEKDENAYFDNKEKNGQERFAILKDGYSNVTNVETMRELMQRVKFSIAYNLQGHNSVPMNDNYDDEGGHHEGNLQSEWYSEGVNQNVLYPWAWGETDKHFDYASVQEKMKQLKDKYWYSRIHDIRDPEDPYFNSAFWITTHNSTYDMSTKTLYLSVQERYDEESMFQFTLN